ncbi:DUF1748-domain-containing protein [Mucor mucedo]|uniref:DUF1748-domain-containing protein n=1 Tax=Mucor saturninus TaxID=64648 RepID=A0A8H7RJL2_9FUNG|nr:DUF1748-domain-containing protein [Mucor mucedo]KAG2212321.1 hypothetical protein INT47_001681 [Mucor saturninus]KAI7894394.1 DUF1748-domain-containing protein [Mucor mucedo]
MWGRLFHFTADAVLISAVLAGIKRNSGLQPATSQIENDEIRKYADKYLSVGEWVVDSGVVFMNNSPYFERKN